MVAVARHVSGLNIVLAVGALVLPLLSSPMASHGQQAFKPLAPNDVSILFPAPSNEPDLSKFIALADLTDAAGAPLVSSETFAQYVKIAESDDSKISGTNVKIKLPPSARDMKAWIVAGIRFDLGAPGLSDGFKSTFGQIPQVRLIVQPVVRNGDAWRTLDIAGHFIFNFVAGVTPPQCPGLPNFAPDLGTFGPVLRDVERLRDDLASGAFGDAADTSGPLGVHPGLSAPSSAGPLRDALVALLQKHLSARRMGAAAVMGLSGNFEPWIFLAMRNVPATGLVAEASPGLDAGLKAQMLSFRHGVNVQPKPAADNLNATTACFVPTDQRKGVSTAELFAGNADDVAGITATIADPTKSHFFNTDCVSCHTETHRLLASGGIVAGIEPSVLPRDKWNVRNFGWFPARGGGSVNQPTITRRTATETAEVVEAVNEFLRQ